MTAGNAQAFDVPLFVVACLVVMETFQRLTGTAAPASSPHPPLETAHLRLSLGWLAAALAAATFVAPDFTSILHSSVLKIWRAPRMATDVRIDTPSMRGMLFPKQEGDPDDPADAVAQFRLHARENMTISPREYAMWINDGIQLLHGRTDQHSRILALTFCNAFPFTLLLPSPKGTPVCMEWGTNMNETQHVPAPQLFGDVTRLMVSKPHFAKEQPPWLIYGAYVDDHFVLAAESDLWRLYTRRPK